MASSLFEKDCFAFPLGKLAMTKRVNVMLSSGNEGKMNRSPLKIPLTLPLLKGEMTTMSGLAS
jgi:hypothetical protein